MNLYHATTPANFELIKQAGYLRAPAYFAKSKRAALEYGYNNSDTPIVIELEINDDQLIADRESFDSDDIYTAPAVFCKTAISIDSAKIHYTEE